MYTFQVLRSYILTGLTKQKFKLLFTEKLLFHGSSKMPIGLLHINDINDVITYFVTDVFE